MDKTCPYIVSVCIPTFTRPLSKLTAFVRFMDSLIETAHDPNDIEIIVKIDSGDETALALCKEYEEKYKAFHFRFIITPSEGYRAINKYVDQLASSSVGQFLALWADDSIMESVGWDAVLYNYLDKTTWFLKPFHGQPTEGNLSPIMHRRLYELVGHTGHYPTDWFWDTIQFKFPIQWSVPEIRCLHSWTGFHEENATDETQGPLRMDFQEEQRIIRLVREERDKK